MLRLEQVRAEMMDRFERVDRRFAQQEQRLERIHQRTIELGDRLEAIWAAISAQLSAISTVHSASQEDLDRGLAVVREDLVER